MGRARLPGPRFARCPLRCGILAHGFARACCSGCGYDFLVAFSCKGRGVCPSCNARRMVETAAHLVDHVFPPLPVRQWVLSVPKRIRPFLHHNPTVCSNVTSPRTCSAGKPPRGSASMRRFTSRPLTVLGSNDSCATVPVLPWAAGPRTARKAPAWGPEPQWLWQATSASRSGSAYGTTGARSTRLGWQATEGFSIDAVHIAAPDRAGLERLLRYCARPPFGLERLEATGSGATGGERIVYRLPRPAPGGGTALSLTPSSSSSDSRCSFLHHAFTVTAITVSWLPGYPPKVGPRLRSPVIGLGREQGAVEGSPSGQLDTQSVAGSSDAAAPDRRTSSRWAALIARIYDVLPLVRPGHRAKRGRGGSMRIIAFVTDPTSVRSTSPTSIFPVGLLS